jgi:hypothetical protein
MDNSTLALFLCFGLPMGLFAIALALIFRKLKSGVKGMKQIAIADDFSFYEDSDGRIHRKNKSFRNIAAYLIFIPMAIGSVFWAGSAAFQENWGSALSGVLFAIIPIGVLRYMWKLQKAPALVFDTPIRTIIMQVDGKEERAHFEFVERFNIAFRPMQDGEGSTYRNHGHYDVSAFIKRKGQFEIASFSGRIKTTIKKADDFVAKLEEIVRPPETQAESKVKATQIPERVIDIEHRLSAGSESHLDLIIEHIQNIQSHAEGSFVVFEVAPKQSYYIQLLNTGKNGVYAEASTGIGKKPGKGLSSAQNQKLIELGWMHPTVGEVNYQRDWQLSKGEDQKRVAELILVTLIETYGFEISQEINVKENLTS